MTARSALGAALLVAIVLAASAGAVRVPPTSIVSMVLARAGLTHGTHEWSATDETIVFEVRLPRVVMAALVGAALSTAGVLFQALLRNPLADPYAIGTSGGAALGAALGMTVATQFGFGTFTAVPALAFLGAVATTVLVYSLARVGGRTPIVTLLLAGVIVSVTLGYAMSLLLLLNDRYGRDTRLVYVWLLGGVTTVGWTQVAVLAVLVCGGCTLAWGWARRLNALSLGEESAASVGLDVERQKTAVILVGSLLTAAAVSAAGLVGFVGLIVPHVARLVGGPNHTRLIPLAMLGGATFLVLADLLARIVAPPTEIPLGIVTAFVGGPLFLYLLRKSRREYRV
jgi:ABC-type Fe3+-siderophore transport system permease subunit